MPRKFKPALAEKKSKIKIKKGDIVAVIAGRDKGKKARVVRVISDKHRVLLADAEGSVLRKIKKHVKADAQRGIKGGIQELEPAIHISNVMLLDSEGNKTRVGYQVEGDKKTRVARSNGVSIAEKKSAAK